MQPSKAKPRTRGAQQILRENAATLKYHKMLAIGAVIIRWVVSIAYALVYDITRLYVPTLLRVISEIFLPLVILLSYYVMKKLSMPVYSDTAEKKLISPGYDLNMKDGFGDQLKDLILWLVLTHLLTMFHNLFYFGLFLLPIRLCYLFWVYVSETTPLISFYTERFSGQPSKIIHIICAVIVLGLICSKFNPYLNQFYNIPSI